ncbi:Fe-S cluster assembly protein SufB, partial [Patescibacteria group bacterium]|nr:Fe-S cluster assembly protein SufB [Patescibacteria group bacterium]
MAEKVQTKKLVTDKYKFGFAMPENFVFRTRKGIDEKVVREISWQKSEPDWMTNLRLKGYKYFQERPMPKWGGDLSKINFDNIYYYIKPTDKKARTWEDLPKDIKTTYDRIGVPEAEKKLLAGVGAQYDSEMVYHSLKKELAKDGVIFLDMDSALREYPDLVKEYFGKVIPLNDNKFAALNSATWSGGSFIYVPKGVKVKLPLQAYFRINAANMGQFERTLIIADEGSYVHYVEGCTAPIYTTDSLHSAVVEIIVKKGARVRYTTVQNWSNNVYNLVTKRMLIEEEGIGEWIDCNLGSKLTMKYPSCYLVGRKARGEILSIAYAGKGQHQDAGGKIIHAAPETSGRVISKSISQHGGRTSYRGLLQMTPRANNS